MLTEGQRSRPCGGTKRQSNDVQASYPVDVLSFMMPFTSGAKVWLFNGLVGKQKPT